MPGGACAYPAYTLCHYSKYLSPLAELINQDYPKPIQRLLIHHINYKKASIDLENRLVDILYFTFKNASAIAVHR